MTSRNIFRFFLHANVSMYIYFFTTNHAVFLVQFGINLHLWVFQKAEIPLGKAACAISAFWKTHKCKLIPNNLNSKPYDYLYLNVVYLILCPCYWVTLQESNWKKYLYNYVNYNHDPQSFKDLTEFSFIFLPFITCIPHNLPVVILGLTSKRKPAEVWQLL